MPAVALPPREYSIGYAARTSPMALAFDKLVREWKATRGHTSSAARMANNPAYQRIIALGMAAVPLILAELRQRPDHWFVALHTITGANPVPPESRTVQEMANAWLAWGLAEGYIEYHADRP